MKYILILLAIMAIGCQPFKSESDSLLSETGANYRLITRSGGWTERVMYCDVAISAGEVEKLIKSLGLETKDTDAKVRVVYLNDGESLDDPKFKQQATVAFYSQLWMPSRHGFAGAFLVYDPKKEVGRLWLSIAYG